MHGWPAGYALDSEETIEFTKLQNVDCMVEEFPLDRANEAFGLFISSLVVELQKTNESAEAMMKGSVRFRSVITMN